MLYFETTDRSESPVLNLSKVNDFRMVGMDFGRNDRHLPDRDNPVVLRGGRDQVKKMTNLSFIFIFLIG